MLVMQAMQQHPLTIHMQVTIRIITTDLLFTLTHMEDPSITMADLFIMFHRHGHIMEEPDITGAPIVIPITAGTQDITTEDIIHARFATTAIQELVIIIVQHQEDIPFVA